jgi:hypothetical protein
MPARPEILLKTDKATVVLELGRDGKFVVKTSSWEDNRTILDGEKLQIQNVEAHWEIVRVPATVTVLPRLGMSGL